MPKRCETIHKKRKRGEMASRKLSDHFTLDFGAFLFISSALGRRLKPKTLIHQFYFGLSFAHRELIRCNYQRAFSACVCLAWYPTTYFFLFVFHTLSHFALFARLYASAGVVVFSSPIATANVFIIIFFNSFCNLLWRRVHADFCPTRYNYFIYFFFISFSTPREKRRKK